MLYEVITVAEHGATALAAAPCAVNHLASAMYTISQLAKRFSLSRSTLIYYDKAGLLKPSGRSHANYRVYSDRDIEKLERIALFRSAGVPLSTIAEIIDQDLDQVEARNNFV